ncbi:MAG: alpha/beta fold hydrolase [Hyphomicrobiaceae bacterium]|nr:alpha/beta fold hydrolase [Hyphomicrobiaceae bacterium]
MSIAHPTHCDVARPILPSPIRKAIDTFNSRSARLAGGLKRGLAVAACVLPALAMAGATARADVLVLVQGYLGSAHSFRASGVADALSRRGWRDGGHLLIAADGRFHAASPPRFAGMPPQEAHANSFYTVELPTEAPVAYQARVLADALLDAGARHKGAPLHVVGHSAGGVVARFTAVVDRRVSIATLVTIASPHLGTAAAEVGSMVGQSPLGWIAPFFGASTVNRSQGLYQDLWRERPGTALGWLNRQQHPSLRYVSVIRATDPGQPLAGDSVVAGISQDMNAVPALVGRSERIVTTGEHGLLPADGLLIADILGAARTAAMARP